VSSTGAQADGPIGAIDFTADGRYVVFDCKASNLVAGDTGDWDVFGHDCQTGATELLSVSSVGNKGNSWSGFSTCAISADGRFVLFDSMPPIWCQATPTASRISSSATGRLAPPNWSG